MEPSTPIAEPAPAPPSPPIPPSPSTSGGRAATIIAAVVIILIGAGAVLFARPTLLLAIALAIVTVVVLSLAWRAVRKARWWVWVGLGVVLLAGLVVAAIASSNRATPAGGPPPVEVTVAYSSTVDISGDSAAVHDEITLDPDFLGRLTNAVASSSSAPLMTLDRVSLPGWTLARTVDGSPVYTRDSTVALASVSPLKERLAVPIELGDVMVSGGGLRSNSAMLLPGDGSTVTLTAATDAVSLVSPPESNRVGLPDGRQQVTLPVALDTGPVTADVLKPYLRNPIGVKVNEVFAAGILWTLVWLGLTALLGLLRKWLAIYLKRLGLGLWHRVRRPADALAR